MDFFKGEVNSVKSDLVKIGQSKDTFIQWLVTKDQGCESYALRRFTMKPDGIISCHNHKYVETLFILQGKVKVNVADESYVLEPGNFIFINKFVPHELVNVGKDDVIFLCIISYEDDMNIKIVEKCGRGS